MEDRELFDGRFRQPDQRTCGAAVLVMERMRRDPAYAALVAEGRHPETRHTLPGDEPAGRFAAEVTGMHRRVTGPVDRSGGLQLPWPRLLGTPPWAVANQLTASRGVSHRVVPCRLPDGRARVLARARSVMGAGHTVPLYVGNGWLPRHVVLLLDASLHTYDPAQGRRFRLDERGFLAGRLDRSHWTTPWAVVLPTDPSPA